MRLLVLCCIWFMWNEGVSCGQEPANSRPITKVSAQVMGARLLTAVTPERPKTPMAKCSNRMVTLDAVIGEDGKVSSLKVLGGFEEFQESALKAVREWTYKPYLLDGEPSSVETMVLVFYPSSGPPGSLFVPDGKEGVKGGDFLPLPPECGPPIAVKQTPPQ